VNDFQQNPEGFILFSIFKIARGTNVLYHLTLYKSRNSRVIFQGVNIFSSFPFKTLYNEETCVTCFLKWNLGESHGEFQKALMDMKTCKQGGRPQRVDNFRQSRMGMTKMRLKGKKAQEENQF
jgi:hypothetical protein